MDINTLVGSVFGWLLIVLAILLGGAGLANYLDPTSMLIVFGGMSCSAMVAFPLSNLLNLPRVLLKTLFAKFESPDELIGQLVNYAEIARREGILSLESMTAEIDNPFIVRGIQMAVDGTDPDLIESILEAELENQVERHQQGKALLDTLGKYAPAFGMIGTLIGLVAMLANMDDPSKIGPGMAAALLTTLYGALLANLLFLPMADKLQQRAAEEILVKTIVIRGVMSIQSGDNPRIVAQKLETYLPPAQRLRDDEEELKAAA